MIIKDLLESIRETTLELRQLERSRTPNSKETELQRRKLSALKEMQKYVTSGDWTRKASREKFVDFAKSNFDYKLTAERYNTTRDSLDVFVFRQDNRLRRVIGEALRLIEQNKVEDGLSCFYASTGIISAREFDYKISEILPEASKKDSFLVEDCGKEIEILSLLMKSHLKIILDGADLDKLSYLMFLLKTDDDTFIKQRRELISKL